MKPLPWSYTALEDFKNCPRAYHAKRVEKSVKEVQGEPQIWGEWVHKQFENRQNKGQALPAELSTHEVYMQHLQDKPGSRFTEQKIALNRALQPCGFLADDVWFRGVIDFLIVDNGYAFICDFKTGKPRSKFDQLSLFALHTFAKFPDVQIVDTYYYWTQTETTTKAVYDRKKISLMWAKFVPDLKQYAQAFKDDIWQPRQSGLCNGWCPLESCEHWKPKRVR